MPDVCCDRIDCLLPAYAFTFIIWSEKLAMGMQLCNYPLEPLFGVIRIGVYYDLVRVHAQESASN